VRQLNRRYDTLKAADETNANVAALRAAGIDAVYLPCDVRDEHTVVVTLDEVRRRWGRVDDGVLYGASTAGQLARLPALLRDGIETNLAVKVSGLVHVVRALESATPPWLVVFSSISSLGADGMATYAGTNAFQNSLVAHLRAAGWRAVAFNWPRLERRRGGGSRHRAAGEDGGPSNASPSSRQTRGALCSATSSREECPPRRCFSSASRRKASSRDAS
jgi:NAD(P)-dependent dehydrogenase (short-subunit alcohol dehydrogenase family)